jgi:dTDP-4-amino-4,6-dideoxygalactose transaminase
MTSLGRKVPFLVFGAPSIEEDEIAEVVDSMRSRWLGTGPKVARFEQAFCAYKGVSSAVAVSSCTAALHLSMVVMGLRPGDEVITSALTFCATVNAIIHAGATPVLVDVDPVTMNLDPHLVEEKVTAKTRAILPVHFAGRPCPMEALERVAADYNLRIIEDCAHAIEASYRGRTTGTFGDFGCFSFYATKNVTTGEGGMVVARRAEDAARVKTLALHGLTSDAWKRFSDEGYRHYLVVDCGFKYNMMDLQAAIGLHQLARVERNWARRHRLWQLYDEGLKPLPLGLPASPEPSTRHALHLYTVLVDEGRTGVKRDSFVRGMTARGIGVGIHYLSVPEHPYYQDRFGWKPRQFPNAMRIGRQTVSLPLTPAMTDEDLRDVVGAVSDTLSQGEH